MIQNDDGEKNENKATKVYPRCANKPPQNENVDLKLEKSK